MTTTPALEAQQIRAAFSHYPSGVAALAAHHDGIDHVLVASSFTVGVSLDPALVLFAVQRTSTTWPLLRKSAAIGISVLAADQALLCRQLAAKDRTNRWDGVLTHHVPDGAILIDGAALTFEATLHSEFPAGDHEIIVLEVTGITTNTHLDPLLFHGSTFRTLT